MAPVVGFALVAMLGLAGCTSDHDALMAQADKGARYEIAKYHVATVACMQRNLDAGVYVNDTDLPAYIKGCFDTSTYGMSDSALKAGGYDVPPGSSLRLIERDPHDVNVRRIVVIDAAVVSLQKLYSDVSVSYGQCWSSTIDLRAGTMTTPEREQCSADLLWQISGRGDQLDTLLTVAPDDVTGG
ncbi:hypothetical protein [Demequina lutea]|uniref:hypothetical protein n=1 Tax=Demequina lutea TaxID=431489 RepID=UPI000781A97E|nr:hypothetical protein [Demequina lutea]